MNESERPAERGRKPNYPIAFRREAVRLVEAGRSQRAVSQELGIHVSTLLDWLKRYGTSYAQARRPRFTAAQRQQAARELLAGRLTLDEALLKYGVLYKKTLRQWVTAYQATLAAPPVPAPAAEAPVASATLHTQLQQAQWQIEALQTLIDQAEATYKIAIRKKGGAKPSN